MGNDERPTLEEVEGEISGRGAPRENRKRRRTRGNSSGCRGRRNLQLLADQRDYGGSTERRKCGSPHQWTQSGALRWLAVRSIHRRGEYKSVRTIPAQPNGRQVSKTDNPNLEGKTLAVTGAGGFIGSAVCARASQMGAKVIGLDRDSEAIERARTAGAAEVIEGDVVDRNAVTRAISGADLVVHTAANVREWGSMEDFIEVNVAGTTNVLDSTTEGARIIHLSSVVVYGYDDPGTQDESAALRSVGIPYVDTKTASDRLARERGAVVIRPGDVYGPGSIPWVVRPLQLMKKRILAVPKNSWMLPVFVDDLVDAIMLGLESGRPGEAYTAWSGEKITFAEYFDRLASAAGLRGPARLPTPALWLVGAVAEGSARLARRPPAIGRFGATFISRSGDVSNEKLREDLGWVPKVTLDEGIARSVAGRKQE